MKRKRLSLIDILDAPSGNRRPSPGHTLYAHPIRQQELLHAPDRYTPGRTISANDVRPLPMFPFGTEAALGPVVALALVSTDAIRASNGSYTAAACGRAEIAAVRGVHEVLARADCNSIEGLCLPGLTLPSVRAALARLCHVNLSRAALADLRAPGARLDNVSLAGASAREAGLSGAVLGKKATVILIQADLSFSDLSQARMESVTASQADLGHCDLRGTVVTGLDAPRVILHGADLRGLRVKGRLDLTCADLSRADLRGLVVEEGSQLVLDGADLSGALVDEAARCALEPYLGRARTDNELRLVDRSAPVEYHSDEYAELARAMAEAFSGTGSILRASDHHYVITTEIGNRTYPLAIVSATRPTNSDNGIWGTVTATDWLSWRLRENGLRLHSLDLDTVLESPSSWARRVVLWAEMTTSAIRNHGL